MSNSPIQKDNQILQKSSDEDESAAKQNGMDGAPILNKSFNPQRVFGNILSLGASEIILRVIAFFGIGFIARKLGPEGFGIVGFAAALFGYSALAVSAGFGDIGTREVARRPQKAADIAVNVILVRLILASITFVAVGLVIWLIDGRETIKLVVVLMSLSLFSLAIDTSWAYKGLERGHRIGAALILSQVLYVGLLLAVVREPADVIYVPLAQFFGELIAGIFLLVPLLRLGGIEVNLRKGLELLKSSGFWTVSRLLRALIYTFDVVLIGLILGEREVGLYTAPYRICMLLVALAVTVQTSYLPSITHALAESAERAKSIAERSVNLAGAVAAPMIVGGMIIAEPLIEAVFGAEYSEGAGAFRLLLLSVGFVFLHGTIHNLMLAGNRTKVEMKIFAVAAAVNIVLNLIFIRQYGIIGAAFITVLSELLTLVMGLSVLYKDGIRLKLFRALVRPVAASLLMGAVLFALGSGQMLVLYFSVGCACYGLFLVIFRGIPQDIQPFLRSVAVFANDLRIKFLKV